MNEAESKEWRDRLGEVMTEHDLKWILEQVEQHIRFGRTSEKEIQPFSERRSGPMSGTGTDLLPLPPTPAYSSGRKARFLASRDYSQNEMLEIVIDAVERGGRGYGGDGGGDTEAIRVWRNAVPRRLHR
jgi:hypothetical protein